RSGERQTGLLLDQLLGELERDGFESAQAGRLLDPRPGAPPQVGLADSAQSAARILGPCQFSPVIAGLVGGAALALDEALDHRGRENLEGLAATHGAYRRVGLAGGQPAALADRQRLFLPPPD